jgi:hypothetical protein
MVRAQFSLSHHRHARSVPRDGLSRACLMFACTQRACGAAQSRAPRHGLLASPALLVSATKNPLSVCVCVPVLPRLAQRAPRAARPRARLPGPQRCEGFIHPAFLVASTSVAPPAPPLGQRSRNSPCSEPIAPSLACLSVLQLLFPSCSLANHNHGRLCSSQLLSTTPPFLQSFVAERKGVWKQNSRADHTTCHHHHTGTPHAELSQPTHTSSFPKFKESGLILTSSSSLSPNHHARSVPRDGLRAFLMYVHSLRACGAAHTLAPQAFWPASSCRVCRPKAYVRCCVCCGLPQGIPDQFCHGWLPSGARQPHGHVRASPAPNAAGALLILHSSLLARP